MLLLASCKGQSPNDRALFNLQGNVKSFVETDLSSGDSSNTTFTEEGFIDSSRSNSPIAGYTVIRSYGNLKVVYEEGGSADTYDFTFDKKGRLANLTHIDGFKVPPVTETTTYEYRKSERLPYRQDTETLAEGGTPQTSGGEISYETDSAGNWTKCSYNGTTHTRVIEYYDTAAADNCPMGKSIDWRTVGQAIMTIIFLLALLAVIAHMVYENYFRRKLPMDFSVEGFSRMRTEAGETPQAPDAQNRTAMQHLDEIYDMWTAVQTDDGEEMRTPLSRKAVRKSHALVDAAIACKPTDPETVARLNETCEVLNNVEKRSFAGSIKFMVVSIVMAVLLSLISGAFNILWIIGASCVIYWLASRETLFMQVRKEVNGNGNRPKFMSALIGGLFGAVATAKTYKTVTKWSDGTTTTDVDNSETWITLIIAIILMIVLAIFMWAIALVNYLRNYILYR